MLHRDMAGILNVALNKGNKIIVLYGARQVGKTTLLKTFAHHYKMLWINGDLQKYQDVFSKKDVAAYQELFEDNNLIIIDEAQNIPDIGTVLKILYDELPHIRIIATGSSTLDLASKTMEPLTGRSKTIKMFPISINELLKTQSVFDVKSNLNSYLTYGMYPEIITLEGANQKRQHLEELVGAYLYKDILQLTSIRHSDKLYKLLQLLAYQIGSLVSVNEISNALRLNHETVNQYITLLEKGFVIQRLSGWSNNSRKEISKMDKIYFTDIGIRNSLISNFNDIDIRQDKGAIWENFLFMERQKHLAYNEISCNSYFWRRYSGAEIDLVEQRDGKLFAYEFKWKNKKSKAPASWLEEYENQEFSVIDSDNFMGFISSPKQKTS